MTPPTPWEEQARVLLLSLLKPTHTIHGFDKHANSHDMIWNKAVREVAEKLGIVL